MRIGCDIGGTFTDIVAALPDGSLHINKTSTTPEDPGRAVVEGIRAILSTTGTDPAAVTEVVHGTTTASNTILQKVGARTAVLTTRGFRDVLEMRRRDRPTTWGLWGQFTPLVERDLRLEVEERTLADGSIHTTLDVAQVKRVVAADGARCGGRGVGSAHGVAHGGHGVRPLQHRCHNGAAGDEADQAGVEPLAHVGGVVAGGQRLEQRAAHLQRTHHRLVLRVGLDELVDLAAGIADTVISFLRGVQYRFVVVCDEPASIADAYALIKVMAQSGCAEQRGSV